MPTYVAVSKTGSVFKRTTPPTKPHTSVNARPIPVFTHCVLAYINDLRRPRANWARSLAEAKDGVRWWQVQSACKEVELVEVRVQVPLTYPRWRAVDNPLPKPRLLDGAHCPE